jgi:hypothetical protein
VAGALAITRGGGYAKLLGSRLPSTPKLLTVRFGVTVLLSRLNAESAVMPPPLAFPPLPPFMPIEPGLVSGLPP